MSEQDLAKKGMGKVAEIAKRLERMRVEYVPIESIRPNSYNPNQQTERDFELLLRSLREDGFTMPIIVQAQTREIVDGEHRWRGARFLGMGEVPVVFVEMTKEQMMASTLRRGRARGSEDVDLSIAVLRDLRELGALDWAQDSLMLDDTELQRLLDDVPAPAALAGAEYSEGWTPARGGGSGEHEGKDGRRDSMSEEASRVNQDFQDRMARTTDPEERYRLEQEARRAAYRINLVYRDAEGVVVRGALEPRPAERLLELCRRVELRGG